MYDYVKQHKWAKLRVGIVSTIALITILLAVMFAGNIEELFTPKVMIYAMVQDVKGLRDGSPVWFSGVEIGSVKHIKFTPDQKVRVAMTIEAESLKYLKKDSRANIMTLGLLGDKYVEITPGSHESEGLSAGGAVEGRTQTEIQDVVQASQDSIAKISDFVSKLEEILVKIEKGKGSISRFIQDPAVYENLKEAIGELTVLVRKIEDGEGTMGRLLSEDVLYNDLASSARDIRLFAQTLQKSDGTLNRLIQDPSLYDRFQKASTTLDSFTQRLATSKGTVNKLIDDDSLYENLNSASAKMNKVLDRIDNGQGLMGSLVKDDELSQELKATIRELNALIKDIKSNPDNYFRFSIF
ncbi:MAG: MCE family protein [Nitrospiraceae bacterium]|nr:MAG: MCE family protein [Nitrospiraceae bacterium]